MKLVEITMCSPGGPNLVSIFVFYFILFFRSFLLPQNAETPDEQGITLIPGAGRRRSKRLGQRGPGQEREIGEQVNRYYTYTAVYTEYSFTPDLQFRPRKAMDDPP